MKKLTFTFTFLILIGLFFSCKKYEEGPSFSLRSKKSRLVAIWQIKEVQIPEINFNATTFFSNLKIVFSHPNSVRWEGQGTTFSGEWKLSDEKTAVEITWNYGMTKYSESWYIYRLKEKELTLQIPVLMRDTNNNTKQMSGKFYLKKSK